MKTYSGELHECPKCKGTGKVARKKCATCEGEGVYLVAAPLTFPAPVYIQSEPIYTGPPRWPYWYGTWCGTTTGGSVGSLSVADGAIAGTLQGGASGCTEGNRFQFGVTN